MYQIYVESKNRAHVLSMSADACRAANVLCVNSGNAEEVLRWVRSPHLVSDGGSAEDRVVSVHRIYADEDDVIVVELSDDPAAETVSGTFGALRMESDADHYSIVCHAPASENVEQEIHFRYGDYEARLLLTVAAAESVYDIVLDFGSEASQMLIKRYLETDGERHVCDLFGGVLHHFYPGEERTEQLDYEQQDSDRYLFRSIFHRRRGSSESLSSDGAVREFIASPPSAADPYLLFVNRHDDPACGERLPNIKISYLSRAEAEGFDLETLHHALVLRFLHEALRAVCDKELRRVEPSAAVALRITLLVPNVMGQHAVGKLVTAVSDHLHSARYLSYLPEGMPRVLQAEVSTCSESDASFMYWMHTQPIATNQNYLVIDMGKGTTDFSIVHVSDARTATSLFRSGFIGAGNALSYGIFEHLILQLTKARTTSRRNKIIRRLLSSDPEVLYKLEQLVEDIKRRRTGTESDSGWLLTDADLSGVEGVSAERLKQVVDTFTTDDEQRLVEGIVERIIAQIAVRVQHLKYDRIVLSGRGFLYPPMLQAVKTILGRRKTDDGLWAEVPISYEPEHAKNGCLYGPVSPINVSMRSNLVGMPRLADATSESMTDTVATINSDIEELKAMKSDEREKRTLFHNMVEKVKDAFREFTTDEGEDALDPEARALSEEKKAERQRGVQEQADENRRLRSMMQSEQPLGSHYGVNTRFYVGGNPYKIVGDSGLADGDEYSLYFDGSDLFVRSSRGSWLLIEDTARIPDNNLLFESLFPWSLQVLGSAADIPRNKAIIQPV